MVARTAITEARKHLADRCAGAESVSPEHAKSIFKHAGAWVDAMLVMETGGEPVAEFYGVERFSIMLDRTCWDDGPGVSLIRAERLDKSHGMIENDFRARFLHWHWFVYLARKYATGFAPFR